jgi:hypothetical protein
MPYLAHLMRKREKLTQPFALNQLARIALEPLDRTRLAGSVDLNR